MNAKADLNLRFAYTHCVGYVKISKNFERKSVSPKPEREGGHIVFDADPPRSIVSVRYLLTSEWTLN